MIDCLVCVVEMDNVSSYLINNFENIHKCHILEIGWCTFVNFNFDSSLMRRCGMVYCQYISLMLYFV
jgi:hypothetical protein